VKTIQFDIALYASHAACAGSIVLRNGLLQTEEEAIRIAEKFLSQPLTREYYELTKDKWSPTFDIYSSESIRGDVLSGAIYIEKIKIVKGCLILQCGS
jgi:hypothetical protein